MAARHSIPAGLVSRVVISSQPAKLQAWSLTKVVDLDQVVNYEVVLADGSIVNANERTNPDLFRVLKGGGNNFGIVTRFDMVTFPARDVWSCAVTCPKESTAQLSETLVDFVNNLTAYPNDHILAMWTYLPKATEHFILLDLMNLDGEEKPRTLRKFFIPEGKVKASTSSIATKLASFIVPSGKQ